MTVLASSGTRSSQQSTVTARYDSEDGSGHESGSDHDSEDNRDRCSASARRKTFQFRSVFDAKLIEKEFKEVGVNFHNAYKIWRYLVQKDFHHWNDVPGIPKAAIHVLNEQFWKVSTCKIVESINSSDGSTTKLLIELQDGKRIESVIMRYGQVDFETYPEHLHPSTRSNHDSSQNPHATRFRSLSRSTLCISSQVGCAMGCSFCATGTMGLLANLTAGEIIEQLYLASRIEPIRNIVFMGMGEPLDNLEEVKTAIQLMTDVRVFNLAFHRVSLSTVGVLPKLKLLQHELPNISLALSLHAPTQEIREQIVPTAKAWKLKDILAAAINFVQMQRQRSKRSTKYQGLLLEYVLIDGINSSVEVAKQLGELLCSHSDLVLLNVIPYNPSSTNETLRRPTEATIDAFLATVRSFGVRSLLRQTLGMDISGACGQLVVNNKKQKCNDVEDLSLVIRTPNQQALNVPPPPRRREEQPLAIQQGSPSQPDHQWKEHVDSWKNRLMVRLRNTTVAERLMVVSTLSLATAFFIIQSYKFQNRSLRGRL